MHFPQLTFILSCYLCIRKAEQEQDRLCAGDNSGWALNPQNPESPDYNPKKPWALGIYEGGGYLQQGVYRPWPNCMMNWFHRIDLYCPVCVEAIRETIELYIK